MATTEQKDLLVDLEKLLKLGDIDAIGELIRTTDLVKNFYREESKITIHREYLVGHLMEILVEKGNFPLIKEFVFKARESNILGNLFIEAAAQGKTDILTYILKIKNFALENFIDVAIEYVIQSGDLSTLQYLLEEWKIRENFDTLRRITRALETLSDLEEDEPNIMRQERSDIKKYLSKLAQETPED